MARTGPYPPEERKWEYILLLKNRGAFFSDTLWGLVRKMVHARIRRGKQWAD
tara:strand:+ start:707 stop:862 length:156 start_codon:yes stop_codon:yes gene_type:complete